MFKWLYQKFDNMSFEAQKTCVCSLQAVFTLLCVGIGVWTLDGPHPQLAVVNFACAALCFICFVRCMFT